MVVYADLVFVTNSLFDTAIIVTTAKVRGIPIRVWRLFVAVATGSIYAVFMFEPSVSFLYSLSSKLLISLLIAYAAFGFGSLQRYGKNFGTYYLLHFASAGAIFAVQFLLLSSSDTMRRFILQPTGTVGFMIDSGRWLSLPAFLCSLWFCRSVFAAKAKTDRLLTYLAHVKVEIEGTVVECDGLIDTGNQLYDPFTGAPVLVMEMNSWRHVLPTEWASRIKNRDVDRIIADMQADSFLWPDRIRLVPYRGINGGSQFMLALKPDKVTVRTNEREYEQSKALVAFDGGVLSASGEYQAIIHPALVQ